MSKLGWAGLAVSFLVFYLIARMVDLDLGYFGTALLIAGAAFGLVSVVSPGSGKLRDE